MKDATASVSKTLSGRLGKSKIDWPKEVKSAWVHVLQVPHRQIHRRQRVIIGGPVFFLFYALFLYCVYSLYLMFVLMLLLGRVATALLITAGWGAHELRAKIQEKQALKL